MNRLALTASLCMVAAIATAGLAEQVDVDKLAAPLRAVGPQNQGQAEAAEAWRELAWAEVEQLPAILAAMDGANPLAINWLRAAADAVAARAVQAGQPLPLEQLETFLQNTKHQPEARVTAYEWIARLDDDAESRLIPQKLNDPSMELRHRAVAMATAKGEAALKAEQKADAVELFAEAFEASRDLEQAKKLAKHLEDLGEKRSLADHFGFVMQWKLVAPFDNVDKKGFDVPYGPESDLAAATYAGKEGEVKWIEHTTEDSLGLVDLNEALARHKGAICYALAEFHSQQDRDCEIRIGCINANKVWLNGELLISNHVYHAGRGMDQYRGVGQLKAGVNRILVKVAQNEQTEQWAQDWQFQLRVCDSLGTAIPNSATNNAK
ncbi:MAG: hypothetical protein KDB14_15405 [Planctomycetales bacterium]|nr:hypothetical protein [Planctomycetales bacterium]